jgi:hypothetical protein
MYISFQFEIINNKKNQIYKIKVESIITTKTL